jgi:hypothetical protein
LSLLEEPEEEMKWERNIDIARATAPEKGYDTFR